MSTASVVPVAPLTEEPIEAIPTPAPEPVVPPAPVEKRYKYQPTDELGRPIGGEQVIKYTTPEELADKLKDQNVLILRQLREVTRKQKLGISDEVALPDDVELENFVEPKPRVLSAEERFQLSQDMNDPEKVVEATNKIIEATVGLSTEQMRQQFTDAQFAKLQHRAYVNYQVFEAQCGDSYYSCPENTQVLTDWMFKKHLAPTVKNFELAASKLKEAGLLLSSPIVREVAPAPPAPASAPVAVPVPVAPVSTEPNPQVSVPVDGRIAAAEPQAKRQVRYPYLTLCLRLSSGNPAIYWN